MFYTFFHILNNLAYIYMKRRYNMFYNYKDIKINYETIGDGIDIVFLHGWGANKEIFKNLTHEIKNKYKVTLIDLPPFGLSTGSHSVITVFDIKDAILSLINYLNISPI